MKTVTSPTEGIHTHMNLFKNVELVVEPTSNPNLLNGTRCYLIGHMQYQDGRGWRELVKNKLSGVGIKFYDPYQKPFVVDVPEDENSRIEMKHWMETEQYDLVASRMKKVVKCDHTLCQICDFFIACITPEVASWGSADEITNVLDYGKPIFLVINHKDGKKATPLWLMGRLDHKYIYNTLDEALNTIKFIDGGIIKTSSDHWNLLQKEQR